MKPNWPLIGNVAFRIALSFILAILWTELVFVVGTASGLTWLTTTMYVLPWLALIIVSGKWGIVGQSVMAILVLTMISPMIIAAYMQVSLFAAFVQWPKYWLANLKLRFTTRPDYPPLGNAVLVRPESIGV